MASCSRRDFIALSALGAVGAISTSRAATAVTGPASPAAAAYNRALVIDANTIASVGQLCCDKDTANNLKIVRASGIAVIKSTLGGSHANFEETVADIAAAQGLIDRFPDTFLKINTAQDMDRAKRDGRVGIIFSFEGVNMLDGKLDRIDLFRQLGVRVMQLTYNHQSPFGYGCLDGDSGGLTDLGRQAIEKMNALGVAVDLSHSNVATTAQSIAATHVPIFTHAGCRAVFGHPRNKNDREMKAMAEKGGVMGIYMLPFLTEDTRQPTRKDYLAHMTHALSVCGEDHVGIGTDVPFFTVEQHDLEEMTKDEVDRQKAGVAAPGENRPPYIPELNSPRKLELVTAGLLQAGCTPRVVDKVLGANFRRVFAEIWQEKNDYTNS